LPDGERRIDLAGKHVLPGVVDPEVHLGSHRTLVDDFRTETRAAAASGVTTWGLQLTSLFITGGADKVKGPTDIPNFMPAMRSFYEVNKKSSGVRFAKLVWGLFKPSKERLEELKYLQSMPTPAIGSESSHGALIMPGATKRKYYKVGAFQGALKVFCDQLSPHLQKAASRCLTPIIRCWYLSGCASPDFHNAKLDDNSLRIVSGP
jgi:hypothetical protein